jgi:PAS domain S-box-containing protein
MGKVDRTRPVSRMELARLLELTPDPFGVVSFDGTYKFVNAAHAAMLGYTQDELLGKPFMEYIHPDDHAAVGTVLGQLDSGRNVLGFECRHLRSEGSIRWIQWNASAQPAERIVYGVGRDVTERRGADFELQALRRVATLAAEGVSQSELSAAVVAEVGKLFHADLAGMIRYVGDETITPVATWAAGGAHPPVTGEWTLEGDRIGTAILRSREPTREDQWSDVPGPIAGFVRDVLGVRSSVGSPVIVDGSVWGALFVHSTHDEPLPRDTESRLVKFTELLATAIANAESRSELDASRRRIVAASDAERRRVVRDLHDGAQQRLVQTVVTLKLLMRTIESGTGDAASLVAEALQQAECATHELGELVHGILPTALTSGGLREGVAALASRISVPVELEIPATRLPAPIEATAYFIVAEALTNVVKHARATNATVAARLEADTLTVEVHDDGIGGVRPQGSGLQGLRDRLAALDGQLRVESPAAGGTVIAATIPVSSTEVQRSSAGGARSGRAPGS